MKLDNVNDISDGFLIEDYDRYIAFINISNIQLTPEAMKNAATNPPLHIGANQTTVSYKSAGPHDTEIKWSIILM